MGAPKGGSKDPHEQLRRIEKVTDEVIKSLKTHLEKEPFDALLRQPVARRPSASDLARLEIACRGASGGILPVEGDASEAAPEPPVWAGGDPYRSAPLRPPYKTPPMKKSTKAWIVTYLFANLTAVAVMWISFGVYGARFRDAASWVVLGWLVLHVIGFLIRAVELSDKRL